MRLLDGYRAQLGERLSILKVSWGRCLCSDSLDLFPHCCVGHPSSTVSNTSTPIPTRIRFNKTPNPSSTAFFLTAHFSEEDYPYDWLMLWLSKRPEWQRSREFETTTRTVSPGMSTSGDNSFGDDDLEGVDKPAEDLTPGMAKTRVVFQPTFESTHTIYYRGHWLRVKRSRKSDGSDLEILSIRLVFFFLCFFFVVCCLALVLAFTSCLSGPFPTGWLGPVLSNPLVTGRCLLRSLCIHTPLRTPSPDSNTELLPSPFPALLCEKKGGRRRGTEMKRDQWAPSIIFFFLFFPVFFPSLPGPFSAVDREWLFS